MMGPESFIEFDDLEDDDDDPITKDIITETVLDDVTDVESHIRKTAVPSFLKSMLSVDDSWCDDDNAKKKEEKGAGLRTEWKRFVVPRRLPEASVDPFEMARVCDGAAVLPFASDPVHNLVYFLLGRQAWNLTDPHRGFRWSMFGGRRDAGEDRFNTASREFVEETLGEARFFTDDNLPTRSHIALASSLRDGQYLFYLKLLYMDGDTPKCYFVFVRQIPWDPSIPHRFNLTREALVAGKGAMWDKLVRNNHPSLGFGSSGKPFVKRKYIEMDSLSWWSVPQLNSGIFLRRGILVNHLGVAEECRSALVATLHITLRFIITM